MPSSFQTTPQEILQQVLNTLRSRFDYVRTALTCRAALSAASDKALLRPWFIRYMRNQYFTLYDGHPKLGPKCVMRCVMAEALGYSFRDAMQLHDICDGILYKYSDELYLQKGFLQLAVSILETPVIHQNFKHCKDFPGSDRRFVQRFLRTAKQPLLVTDTFFSGEWYKVDDRRFYTFDAVVRQPMGDFDVGDRLCLVFNHLKHPQQRYMALDTFGRVFHGAVLWEVHLPGGLTLIDFQAFTSMFHHADRTRFLKLDLGPELRPDSAVISTFEINKDWSGDLTIRGQSGLWGLAQDE
ncbi:hypothetical protein HK104_001689 [Borealophlyctis nickersoniae]|nr:hypothetical protein HK104_001689 [Borealophlyctis nickersoniae]